MSMTSINACQQEIMSLLFQVLLFPVSTLFVHCVQNQHKTFVEKLPTKLHKINNSKIMFLAVEKLEIITKALLKIIHSRVVSIIFLLSYWKKSKAWQLEWRMVLKIASDKHMQSDN